MFKATCKATQQAVAIKRFENAILSPKELVHVGREVSMRWAKGLQRSLASAELTIQLVTF